MEYHRCPDDTPPYQNTRSKRALRRATCAPHVPILDQWGQPEVTTPTTVWVEAVQREYNAVEILDLPDAPDGCDSTGCWKTHRMRFKPVSLMTWGPGLLRRGARGRLLGHTDVVLTLSECLL